MPAYSEVLTQSKNTSATYAIQYVKYQNVKNNFYLDIVSTPVREDQFTFVNPNYVLPSTYKPDDLVLLNVPLYHLSSLTESNYLRKEAADATKQLFDAAKDEQGFQLMVRCGFQSYETQKTDYNKYKKSEGLTYADKVSIRPGHSEHQTGLAIDVTIPGEGSTYSEDFGKSAESSWLAANAHRFGFIIRYPSEQSLEMGYTYEPWHLRYVGVEAATEIYEKNWVFEDYVLEYGLLDELN
ncbi:MAG TPA: D-alanyl-D-alanine carboxypeptidase [Firmicutes bacterium]|nr:D-alanyl-D-alanine carboxypeptidase [Bacillota bacterium]